MPRNTGGKTSLKMLEKLGCEKYTSKYGKLKYIS
jgi:hypothetical protein